MEYSISKLARISGVTTRTLRYYDEIGLLKPRRISSNGYRIYGENQVNLLQQILFYKELGIGLEDIDNILNSSDYNIEKSLQEHLIHLNQEKIRIELLIKNVNKTISSLKGETIMSDKEKFEGFKNDLIKKNEEEYGSEIRDKYGDEVVDASNAKLASMSQEQWQRQQDLTNEISEKIKLALKAGEPAGQIAQEACELHRQWLSMFWKDGMYSKEAHLSLGQMYVEDERFKKYYDEIEEGAAEFLYEALKVYCR
ncbi:MAG: MerR family transcriptional regulator [Tissierella sp.]|nr:MerR family transcriptional regulator [Tissierella sp.]